MKKDDQQREDELREELEFHLETEAEERVEAGCSPEEARYAAHRDLGNLALIMEDTRSSWGRRSFDTLWQDFRYAVRWLRSNASFSILAVLILGLGVGCTTAVFNVVNAVLLKPLSYPDAARITVLQTLWKKTGPGGAPGPNAVSAPDFHDWHDQTHSFEAMAYFAPNDGGVLTVATIPEFGSIASVTSEFFKVFGADPIAGRTFAEGEVGPGRPGGALLSYAFALVHYGSPSGALGHTLRVGDRTVPVIGVLPAGFQYPGTTDVWLPANTFLPESPHRGSHNVQVVAKLKTAVKLEQAQAELTALGGRLEQQYPDTNRDKNVSISRLQDNMVKDARVMLIILLAAAGLVLLVACSNVANLLLAKAAGRTREIALRVAFGAGRKRIIQQLLTESLSLAIGAAAVGMVVANLGSNFLMALAPQSVPRVPETAVGSGALTFSFTVSLVSCLLFGLAPAVAVSKSDMNDALKQSGTRTIGGRTRTRLRRGLVIAEIALSVILLIGAILLIRSFDALLNVPLGFEPENVLIMETSIPTDNSVDAWQQATNTYKKILVDLSTIPGVVAVGAVRVPPGAVASLSAYRVDRATFELLPDARKSVISIAAPGAFAALGIPIKAGRDFSTDDTFDAPLTAIINEQLAKEAFPGHNPIGHTIVNGLDSSKPMTIVGIVGDVHQRGPAVAAVAEIYMPYEQHPGASAAMQIVARTNVPPENMFEVFRHHAQTSAPHMPVRFTTMEARLSGIVAAPRFRALLLGIFAALAVILAMSGIYAVVSFVVDQRISEIGLRIALGAAPHKVLRMVLSEGFRMAQVGLIVGLVGALAVNRFFSTLLFRIDSTDTVTYLATIVLVTLVTLLASYFPAQRAARVDPSTALREE